MKNLDNAIKFVSDKWKQSETKSRTTLNEIVKEASEKYNVDTFSILYSIGMA